MIDKFLTSPEEAIADVADGSTILVSGFGGAGLPGQLLTALVRQGARDLVIVSNNAGNAGNGIAQLVAAGRVRKIICSFPRQPDSGTFEQLYREGKIEVELVPQGTLSERIRAGGAGIAGFYTPTAYGTELSDGKEVRVFDGVGHVLERGIRADWALIKASTADRWGNLTYHRTGRNFGPVMATAARCTVVQVRERVELGAISPEHVITPSIFVHRIILERSANE
jgi:3-oxoadipate CoA-transferase alpha subunit